jgi:hypothetical protein
VEPLLLTRRPVGARDHRAPADVVAHAVARLGRVSLFPLQLSLWLA